MDNVMFYVLRGLEIALHTFYLLAMFGVVYVLLVVFGSPTPQ